MAGRHAFRDPGAIPPPCRERSIAAAAAATLGVLLVAGALLLAHQPGALSDPVTVLIVAATIAGIAGICAGIWLQWAPPLADGPQPW